MVPIKIDELYITITKFRVPKLARKKQNNVALSRKSVFSPDLYVEDKNMTYIYFNL